MVCVVRVTTVKRAPHLLPQTRRQWGESVRRDTIVLRVSEGRGIIVLRVSERRDSELP